MTRMSRGQVVFALAFAGCATAASPPKPAASPAVNDDSVAASASADEGEPLKVSPRGWLGVEVSVSPDADGGVFVRGILRGSPAELAGLQAGDRILKLGGAPVVTPGDVVRLVSEREPGVRLPVVVRRAGAERLLAVKLGSAPDVDGVMRMSFVDAAAPRLDALETVQGSIEPSLSALRGQVVVLEFWASWCGVCRFLVPKMNEWHARYSAQGVVVLGITMDAVVPASRAASQLGILYPVASDHSGKTTVAYRANALPTLFVIDKRGVVRDVLVGYSSGRIAELEGLVQRLTDER
ncbi:MAG: redoxin domain-containing protein [Myxococcales bacterium]|nr:redoxin domain-containing protein [Myxococcales bacterium]